MFSSGTSQTSPAVESGDLPQLAMGRQLQEDRARLWIARVFVVGYLSVLILSLSPVVIYIWTQRPLSLSDVKDLGALLAAAISSLSGLLGFVLGYYFKASETTK